MMFIDVMALTRALASNAPAWRPASRRSHRPGAVREDYGIASYVAAAVCSLPPKIDADSPLARRHTATYPSDVAAGLVGQSTGDRAEGARGFVAGTAANG